MYSKLFYLIIFTEVTEKNIFNVIQNILCNGEYLVDLLKFLIDNPEASNA